MNHISQTQFLAFRPAVIPTSLPDPGLDHLLRLLHHLLILRSAEHVEALVLEKGRFSGALICKIQSGGRQGHLNMSRAELLQLLWADKVAPVVNFMTNPKLTNMKKLQGNMLTCCRVPSHRKVLSRPGSSRKIFNLTQNLYLDCGLMLGCAHNMISN